MPNSIISEGNTTNEAIENGLKKLGVSKNQVEIKILQNDDKRSFFSILAPRIVKVELILKDENTNKKVDAKPKEIKRYSAQELEKAEEKAKSFLDVLLGKFGSDIKYQITKKEDGIEITINGKDSGFLIGYRGETLYALQRIISAVASKGIENRIRVMLDIENYREKRVKTLENLAERMANRVIRTGRSVTLEPMKPYERKIIHSKLQNSKMVTTQSVGEEPYRRLIISLK